MSKLTDLAVQIAKEEIEDGAGEEIGNNDGPYVVKYLNGYAPAGSSWCMAFVSWVYNEACETLGIGMLFPYSVGAKSTWNYIKKMGWDADIIYALPGDILFFNRTSDPKSWMGHAELVCEVENGTITTIAGNVGSFPAKVKYVNYNKDSMPANFIGVGSLNDR
jgi:hypothetical protein